MSAVLLLGFSSNTLVFVDFSAVIDILSALIITQDEDWMRTL
jgi:hypothetical protein